MMTIGIRDLKARLSQILREVQHGEVVLVTDRGRVVAELRTPTHSPRPTTAAERAVGHLAARGELRLAERAHQPYPASPLSLPAGTSARLLAEDRDER